MIITASIFMDMLCILTTFVALLEGLGFSCHHFLFSRPHLFSQCLATSAKAGMWYSFDQTGHVM